MATTSVRVRAGVLVAVGMGLFFAGVVSGSAVGTLIRDDTPAEGNPLLLGETNRSGNEATRLFASTSGGALWATQNGSGSGIRGESVSGHGGAFESRHRNGSGVLAENTAPTVGNGAAITATGNTSFGIRATSDAVGVWAEGSNLGVYSSGDAVVSGQLTLTNGCLGCFVSLVGMNTASTALIPGQVVTIVGTRQGRDGTLIVELVPAAAGDVPVGIMDVGLLPRSQRANSEASVTFYETTQRAIDTGGLVRVIVGGVVTSAIADDSGGEIEAGDALIPGHTPGLLVRRGSADDQVREVGMALGPVRDGLVPVLVAPH